MNGYAKKVDENVIMSFRVNIKLLQNYDKIWGKKEKLMRIDFENKPVYSDGDKSIKTKAKICASSMITNFHNKKNVKRKITMQVFINNIATFCY